MNPNKETLYKAQDQQKAVNFVAFWAMVLMAVFGLAAAVGGEKWIPIACLLIAIVAGYFAGKSHGKCQDISRRLNQLDKHS